jgi:replication fork clamp-binding protein CrfC
MDKKNAKLDIDSLVQKIKEIKLQQLKNEKELESLSQEVIKLLGSDKSYSANGIKIWTIEDIEYSYINLQKLKNELSNILASEIISKILDKSKVKKNKSGGITIRLVKK